MICIWFWKYSVINRQFQCFKDRSVKQSCNLKNYIVKKCYTSEVFLRKISSDVNSILSKRQDIMKKNPTLTYFFTWNSVIFRQNQRFFREKITWSIYAWKSAVCGFKKWIFLSKYLQSLGKFIRAFFHIIIWYINVFLWNQSWRKILPQICVPEAILPWFWKSIFLLIGYQWMKYWWIILLPSMLRIFTIKIFLTEAFISWQ